MNDATQEPVDMRSEDEIFDEFYAQEQREAAVNVLKGDIESHKEILEMAEAIVRLEDNPDFKLVIEKGYIEEVPKRLTKFLGGNLDEHTRADAQMSITAVGVFQYHFEGIMQMSAKARLELPRLEQELVAISAEQ